MITGTSHFVSVEAAVSYYAEYEDDARRAVERKLAAGEIHIGCPAVNVGQRLLLIDEGRRYAIED